MTHPAFIAGYLLGVASTLVIITWLPVFMGAVR
jgi:hypothetical protein